MQMLFGLAGEHDVFYALYALLYATPVMLATWFEPLACDNFLVQWGGHVLFDFSIPASAFVYFVVAQGREARPTKKAD